MAKAKEEPKSPEQIRADQEAAEKELAAEEREEALAAQQEEAEDNDADREEYTIDPETRETRPRDWENDPEPGPHPSTL